MAAQVIFNSTTEEAGVQGSLFQDLKFWLSQRVPQRARFINDIKANGGDVVAIEKNADILIVDHARKEALPGTHSYKFIEQSIRNGALEDLADHAVGAPKGTVRSVGSVVHPSKGTRQKYTQEDERILWDWVNTNPQKTGGTDGNEIYKQLEAKHPQHPWQSWRDHWVKQMKHKPRPVYPPNNAPPTPPSEMAPTGDQNGRPERPAEQSDVNQADFDTFTEDEAQILMDYGQDIIGVLPEYISEAWAKWAADMDPEKQHTAAQWQVFWEQSVRPRFLRRKAKGVDRAAATERTSSKPKAPVAQIVARAASPVKDESNARVPRRSPSYPPESPKLPSAKIPAVEQVGEEMYPLRTPEKPKEGLRQGAGSPIGNSFLKRKHSTAEEVPSSSPPQLRFSPVPKGHEEPKRRKEIASTPDRSPRRAPNRHSPFLLEDFEQANEAVPDSQESDDGLGQQPSESLSEPDRTAHPTQALFREPTPTIDLEVVPPGDGWDDEEAGGNKADSESEGESQYESASDEQQAAVADTQAVLESRTQVPDLDVPDPDGGWDTLLPSSPPVIMASSPPAYSESQTSSNNLKTELEVWVSNRVVAGFSEEQAYDVFNRACMDTELAAQALQHMKTHDGEMPQDLKGLWTEEDDHDLYSSDARKVGRLERKHGAACLSSRWEFLDLLGEE